MSQTAPDTSVEDALSRDIHFLGDMLGEVIVELEGQQLFALEEFIRATSKARRGGDADAAATMRSRIAAESLPALKVLIKAFSNYFQLVNLAEDAQRVRVLRQRELAGELPAESIEETVETLAGAAIDDDTLRRSLEDASIRLVFTAHPTEAKRSVVLAKLREIAIALEALEQPGLLPRERWRATDAARAAIVSLWQTRVARPEKPPVLDEVYHGLYFLTNTLLEVLPDLEEDLERLVAERLQIHGWRASRAVHYGTWIGGDRDGNPFVTPETTIKALEIQRDAALASYQHLVERLGEQLSQSTDEVPAGAELLAALEAEAETDPTLAAEVHGRYQGEPYRQMLAYVAARLRAAAYATPEELLKDLKPMAASLQAHDASGAVTAQVDRLIRRVETFGLTLPTMDIRQEAASHHRALAEILEAAGVREYLDLDDGARLEVLSRLVESGDVHAPETLGEATADTWQTLQAIATAHARFGPSCIDAYVISLSRCAADVMAVLLLATMAGVDQRLDIVPLFETHADLQAAPRVLETLFANPAYRDHLSARGGRQQVMIGYSDSNKEGGYLSAHWHLYLAQRAVADVCSAHDIVPEFFHGRGGTTARGGGPANRAILAQPGGTVRGRLKMTEQGEVIAERYANRHLAYRHLSQVINAVVRASLKQRHPLAPELVRTMELAAASSRQAYQGLINADGFGHYFEQATPLNEIARLTIGSRPARRAEGAKPDSLRAIPWVFSWMQCRANVPGWYGLGSGLAAAARSGADLHAIYLSWDFFRGVIDNAQMALAKTDLGIASLYTELVEDRDLRERIFTMISNEYERTVAMVLQTANVSMLLESAPELRLSIERRNPYVDPLNYLQVELLQRFRRTDEGSPEHNDLRAAIFQTINGIAAGMKNTG